MRALELRRRSRPDPPTRPHQHDHREGGGARWRPSVSRVRAGGSGGRSRPRPTARPHSDDDREAGGYPRAGSVPALLACAREDKEDEVVRGPPTLPPPFLPARYRGIDGCVRRPDDGLIEFRLLGPVEAVRGDQAGPLGGPRQRALLALLLIESGRPIAADRLAEELWSGRPTKGSATTLRAYISKLRAAVGAGCGDQRRDGGVRTRGRAGAGRRAALRAARSRGARSTVTWLRATRGGSPG